MFVHVLFALQMSDEQSGVIESSILEQRLERIDPQLRLEPSVERALQLMAVEFAGETQRQQNRGREKKSFCRETVFVSSAK